MNSYCSLPCLTKEQALFDHVWTNYDAKSSATVIFFRQLRSHFHDSPEWTTASCNVTTRSSSHCHHRLCFVDSVWLGFASSYRRYIFQHVERSENETKRNEAKRPAQLTSPRLEIFSRLSLSLSRLKTRMQDFVPSSPRRLSYIALQELNNFCKRCQSV